MTDRVDQQFGAYRLIRLIGKGGFADVYLAEHRRRSIQAAVKVLHARLEPNNLKSFLNEARSFRLKHPHIVQLLDFGLEDDYPYLVMEYAMEGSLRRRHPKGSSLALPLVVSYVQQVSEALQYAHEEGIVHRDIKPENMLVGASGDVLLSDFGIASIAHTTHSLDIQDQAGTITYMAPEQIQGKPRPASDQYSLGIVVYEWLNGDRPFHGSLSELVGQHLTVPPPSLQEKVPTISPEVNLVVMKSLAKDPKQRFESVQAFAEALKQASLPTQFQSIIPQKELPAANQPLPSDAFSLKGQSVSPSEMALPSNQIPPISKASFVPSHEAPSHMIHSPYPTQSPDSEAFPPKQTRKLSQNFSSKEQQFPQEYRHLSQPPQIPEIIAEQPVTRLDLSFLPPGLLDKLNQSSPLSNSATQSSRNKSTYINQISILINRKVLLMFGLALLLIISSVGLFSYVKTEQIAADNSYATVQAIATATAQANATATTSAALNATAIAPFSAYDKAIATSGIMFGFDPQHTRLNPYEKVLTPTNVSRLVRDWTFQTGWYIFSSPAVANGVVYIGSSDHNLYAVDARTGSKLWVFQAGDVIYSSPAVANGVVYFASFGQSPNADHTLYALDARTGNKLWAFHARDAIPNSPAVANGVVYVGSFDHYLYALDASTGNKLWAFYAQDAIRSSPAVANGVVYVGSVDHYLYALDASTGNKLWAFKAREVVDSSPAIANGVVYVGSNDGEFYALDAGTGNKLWAFQIGISIYSSPTVANGVVYVASFDGNLHALDASTGNKLWAFQAKAMWSSPAVANGVVYIGSADHNLYAFHLSG